MAITPFEEFEVFFYSALWSLVAFILSWAGLQDAEAIWCRLIRPLWAPPLSLVRLLWVLIYIALAVCFYLVRRTADLSTVLVSFVLYLVLIFSLAFWPWLLFRFRQLRLTAFFTILLIVLAAFTGFFFLAQNSSGVIGAVVIIITFIVLLFVLIYLAGVVIWIANCPQNSAIINQCSPVPGVMAGPIEQQSGFYQPRPRRPNVVTGAPTRPIYTSNTGPGFPAFGSGINAQIPRVPKHA